MEQIKELSYDCNIDSRTIAEMDRQKVSKLKSPDVTKKKYRYYSPEFRCTIFSDKKSTLNNMVSRLDLEPVEPKKRSPKKPDELTMKMIEMYNTMSCSDIGKSLRLSLTTVWRRLKNQNVEMRNTGVSL